MTISEFDGQPGHALGSVDGKTYRLLGLVEIDDHAGLHAARFLVADADDLRLVRAATQQLAFADRLQPRDHAAHLARADVEYGDNAGAARRTVLLGAEPAHTFFPGFDLAFTAFMRSLIAAVRATAASGVSCTTRRPANRMSTAAMSRDSRPASRSDRRQLVDRLIFARLGKLDRHAVFEPYVPTPLGNAHVALDAGCQLWAVLDLGDEAPRASGAPMPITSGSIAWRPPL